MDLGNNETNLSSSRSTLYCSYAPPVTREDGSSAFNLIIGLITVMASFPTVTLNTFIILAIKQRSELQKPSNVMLSSLAVSDLLVGVIVMPISAIINFFSIRHPVSFEYKCILYVINMFFETLLFTATLYHLTVIGWERYVAVLKWMDYMRIITNGRIKKIAIATWLFALFPTVANLILKVLVVDRRIIISFLTAKIAVDTACLFLVVFFYRKIYLEIRNRKLNEISQIDALMKAKMESKVAKTTVFLTAAVISFYSPLFVIGFLGRVVPVVRSNAAHRFLRMVTHLNSLFNPLIYCYRDHRFRNAILELLRMKKPQAILSAARAAQFTRQKDPFRSSELQKVGKCTQRLTRSASCNLTGAFNSIHETHNVIMLKKSLSVPTLYTRSSSLEGLDLQQPPSIVETSATIHADCSVQSKAKFHNPKGNKDATKPKNDTKSYHTKIDIL